jgi:hypothetical protein
VTAPTRPLELPYSAYIASRRVAGREPRLPRGPGPTNGLARVCVGADGHVADVSILRGSSEIGDALRQAVRTWQYRPFASQGHPVAACFNMPFEVRRDQ